MLEQLCVCMCLGILNVGSVVGGGWWWGDYRIASPPRLQQLPYGRAAAKITYTPRVCIYAPSCVAKTRYIYNVAGLY